MLYSPFPETPPEEPERTQLEWMCECRHCAACVRACEAFADWYTKAEMAERLNCAECEEWED